MILLFLKQLPYISMPNALKNDRLLILQILYIRILISELDGRREN